MAQKEQLTVLELKTFLDFADDNSNEEALRAHNVLMSKNIQDLNQVPLSGIVFGDELPELGPNPGILRFQAFILLRGNWFAAIHYQQQKEAYAEYITFHRNNENTDEIKLNRFVISTKSWHSSTNQGSSMKQLVKKDRDLDHISHDSHESLSSTYSFSQQISPNNNNDSSSDRNENGDEMLTADDHLMNKYASLCHCLTRLNNASMWHKPILNKSFIVPLIIFITTIFYLNKIEISLEFLNLCIPGFVFHNGPAGKKAIDGDAFMAIIKRMGIENVGFDTCRYIKTLSAQCYHFMIREMNGYYRISRGSAIDILISRYWDCDEIVKLVSAKNWKHSFFQTGMGELTRYVYAFASSHPIFYDPARPPIFYDPSHTPSNECKSRSTKPNKKSLPKSPPLLRWSSDESDDYDNESKQFGIHIYFSHS